MSAVPSIGIQTSQLDSTPPRLPSRLNHLPLIILNMDVEMGDVGYDIDIDVGASVETTSAQPQQQVSSAWRAAVAVS